MLRVMGESLMGTGVIGLKKATRRRLRTILQGMMYLCGRLTRHARRVVVKVASNGGFGEALVNLHRRLATVWTRGLSASFWREAWPSIAQFRRND